MQEIGTDWRPLFLFLEIAQRFWKTKKALFSKDLGVVKVAEEIAQITEKSTLRLNEIGVEVAIEIPYFS